MNESSHTAAESKSKQGAANTSALDILLDIELPVKLRFGQRQMTLEDILRLGTGSIVEFDRAVEDPVEVLVNDRLVARGAAVTVDGHYGVRILEIASPRDRLGPGPDVRVRPVAAAAGA